MTKPTLALSAFTASRACALQGDTELVPLGRFDRERDLRPAHSDLKTDGDDRYTVNRARNIHAMLTTKNQIEKSRSNIALRKKMPRPDRMKN